MPAKKQCTQATFDSDFYGRTPEELREEFKNSVEDYLTWCAEEGTKPEKTWVGKS